MHPNRTPKMPAVLARAESKRLVAQALENAAAGGPDAAYTVTVLPPGGGYENRALALHRPTKSRVSRAKRQTAGGGLSPRLAATPWGWV